jgi:hypothetical protein
MGATTAVMAGVGALGVGASLFGSSKAADAQLQAANSAAAVQTNALNFQKQQYNTTLQNQQPWYQTGVNALSQINELMGLPSPSSGTYNSYAQLGPAPTQMPGETRKAFKARQLAYTQQSLGLQKNALISGESGGSATPNTSTALATLQQTPGYQFRMDQGMNALDRTAAAQGNLMSGGHTKDVLNYAQGLASDEYTNQFNRLATLSGFGQTANQTNAATGVSTGTNVGNTSNNLAQNALYAGNASASQYINSANAINGGINAYQNYNMYNNMTNALAAGKQQAQASPPSSGDMSVYYPWYTG